MDTTDKITWDSKLTGFGLRERNGRKSWIIQYRVGSKQRRLTLASAEKLTQAQARDLARKKLAEVSLGRDPAIAKEAARAQAKFTLGAMIKDYLDMKRAAVRPRTFREIERYLGNYWKPLHRMPINAIGRRDVAAELGRIGRTHGATTAARARVALSGFYIWLLGEGIAEHNVVVGTNRPAEGKPRDHVIADQELARIWRALPDGSYSRIVKLLILCGCRREEIGKLKWVEVDETERVIRLPAERAKNHRARVIVLSDMAWRILSEQPRLVGSEFVFGPRGFSGWSFAKANLDQRLDGAVRPFVLHDMRRYYSTRLNDLGVLPHVVEVLLGHQTFRAGVPGTYNYSAYRPATADAVARWEDHVRSVVEGGERRVLAFPHKDASGA